MKFLYRIQRNFNQTGISCSHKQGDEVTTDEIPMATRDGEDVGDESGHQWGDVTEVAPDTIDLIGVD